jgi:pyruvate dehydrogenase E1 component alpha subunit
MSDPAKYRTREEVQEMRQSHDPLDGARVSLADLYGVDEAALRPIEDEVKAIVQEAADFAQSSPEPDASELWTDVLTDA